MKTAFAGLLSFVFATSVSAQSVNEFVANHVGTDTNEYVEVIGDPNTDLSSLKLLQIEGDAGGAGAIDSATAVGTTDVNGLWWSGFMTNVIENGTITFLLVDGFSGSVGNDIDANNDGVIDNALWTSIVDCVGNFDGGATDHSYCSVVLDSTLPPAGFIPGGASRIPNGQDTDSVSDWKRNDFDGEGIPGFTGTLDTASGEVLNTPGLPNVVPEPATLVLFSLGGLAGSRRRGAR